LIAKLFDYTYRSDLRIQVDAADLSLVLFMEEIYVVYRAPYARRGNLQTFWRIKTSYPTDRDGAS